MSAGRQRLIAWTRRTAGSPRGQGGLFVLSVLETTIVPVPIEAILVPMMLTARRQI